MIQKKDVKVYLKVLLRPGAIDYCNKWISACEKIGLDYVFVSRGCAKPEGNPVDFFNWDVPSKLGSEIESIISISPISNDWRSRAMAHCLPFWHNDREYTINIDADDSIHEADMGNLLLSALKSMDKNNTPIFSHDVHFSISDDKLFGINTWPHIWCMGVCLANTKFMKESIITSLFSRVPNHIWKNWLNLDLVLDKYFQYEFDFPICYISKTGRYIHGLPGYETYFYLDSERDFVIKDYSKIRDKGNFDYRKTTRHPRTVIIDVNEI